MCYTYDTSTNFLSILTSIRDDTNSSHYTNFYFLNNNLVKVETGNFNGKKYNTRYYYYTQGDCQVFNPYPEYQDKKKKYLELSDDVFKKWKDKIF